MKEKLFIPPPVREITLLADQPQAFKRILIMEDNPELAKKIQRYLEARHFDVFFAKTAVCALREIIDQDFDVIICDMIKPHYSGQMFHVAVSRVKPYLCNRFIFATGRTTPGPTAAFIKEVNGVMIWKPFETHVLLETIQLVLKKRAARVKAKIPEAESLEPEPSSRCVRSNNAENLRFMQLSLDAAMQSIRIVSSYFVCDEATLKCLIIAGQRGVKVEILVPARINGQDVDVKAQALWAKLLEAGVKIYITESAPDSGRVIICDDAWVLFTRSNFNAANLNFYQGEFATRYVRSFDAQKRNAEQMNVVSENEGVASSRESHSGESSTPNFYTKLKSVLAGLVSAA